MGELNLIALVVAVLLAVGGGGFVLRGAGYPWSKTVFGALAGLVVVLSACGVVLTIQSRAGLESVPLLWLVPVAVAAVLWKLRSFNL